MGTYILDSWHVVFIYIFIVNSCKRNLRIRHFLLVGIVALPGQYKSWTRYHIRYDRRTGSVVGIHACVDLGASLYFISNLNNNNLNVQIRCLKRQLHSFLNVLRGRYFAKLKQHGTNNIIKYNVSPSIDLEYKKLIPNLTTAYFIFFFMEYRLTKNSL